MTMTKKERAEFDAAIAKAQLLAALRWTEEVKKDVSAPSMWKEESTGWDFNISTAKVHEYWSTNIRHGIAPKSDGQITLRNPKELFSTKLLALRAMRHEIEKEVARRLMAVDKMISAELESLK